MTFLTIVRERVSRFASAWVHPNTRWISFHFVTDPKVRIKKQSYLKYLFMHLFWGPSQHKQSKKAVTASPGQAPVAGTVTVYGPASGNDSREIPPRAKKQLEKEKYWYILHQGWEKYFLWQLQATRACRMERFGHPCFDRERLQHNFITSYVLLYTSEGWTIQFRTSHF